MAEKIAFVGLGIMGKPMAKNLMEAGYELYVYDLFPDPVSELEKEGATGCKSAAEASSNANITVTMVQDGPQAESAILGEGGVADGASKGHLVVDMSSIAPGVSQRIGKGCSDRFGRKINILISTFLMIVAIIIAITGLNFYLSVFCLVLMFFFSVSLETSLDALLGQLSPEQEKSSIVSRYSTWQDIGAAMGPLVGFMIAIGYGVQFGYIVSIFMFSICLYGFYRLFLRD